MNTEESALLAKNRERARNKIRQGLLSGRCIRVLGPRFTGKSDLIREAAAETRKELSALVSYQSMEDYKQAGWPDFFSHLYRQVAADILPGGLAPQPASSGKERPAAPAGQFPGGQAPLAAPVDLQYHLLNLLQQVDRNVVIFIDDLEIAPPNLIASLLGVIRAVFNTTISGASAIRSTIGSGRSTAGAGRSFAGVGIRFQAVVCGSLSFSQLALPHVSRFESISDLVLVSDLNPAESRAFVEGLCALAGIITTEEGLLTFLEYTGGDRYLIRRMVTLVDEFTLTPQVVEKAGALFLAKHALETGTQDAIRQIESDPNLLSCVLQILDKGRVPSRDLPLPSIETPNLLDLSGICKKERETYEIKCRLWREILASRLNPARAGRLYALAGYWPEAIQSLTRAAELQPAEVKLDLFNATINAMHASPDGEKALQVLAQGLRGIYADLPFRIYQCTAAALVQVYPQTEPREDILLSGPGQPEIEALHGPDYSAIYAPTRTRFCFPIRLRSTAEPLGMLSFDKPFDRLLQAGHQEEVYQLIGFLRQAARAVEARDTYAAALLDAQSRAEKQNNLNKILTEILHRYDLPDETILRLVLAGVTAGFCLEFNRAILFIYDEDRKTLVARLGVGHLDRQEAETDWIQFPYQNLDELIQALQAPQIPYTSLHHKIKGFAIPAQPAAKNLFAHVMAEQEPKISRRQLLLEGLPQGLVDIIGSAESFALIPFNAGSRMRGILYVDNRYTQRDISDERIFILHGFINQAELVIKLAQALKEEQKRTTLLAELLNAEEAINDQITQRVEGVLDQIAGSARTLFKAKCTVLYTLDRHASGEQISFVTDQIVYKGTALDHSADSRPTSDHGITQRVIEQGLVYIPDIAQARQAGEYEEVWQSSFVQQEQVQASAGVRLGTAAEPEGVLYLNWDTSNPLTEEDQAVITIFASYAAVTIPSARRYQQVQDDLQHRMREMEGLSQLIRAGVELWSEEEIREVIRQALETTRELTGVADLNITRRGPHSQLQQYRINPDGALIPPGYETVKDSQTVWAFSQEKPVSKCLQIGEGCYWPIRVGGNLLGVLWMQTGPQPDQQTALLEKHTAYLDHLCNRLALTFHQSEVYQALSKLFQAALRMTHDTDREDFLDDFMRVLVSEALESVWAVDTITTYYIDKDWETLKLGPCAGLWDNQVIKQGLPQDSSVVHEVVNAAEPIFAENAQVHPLLKGRFVEREQIKSAAAFPLRVGENRVGSIFFSYRHYQKFDPGEKSLLNLFAQLAAIAINYARLLEEARHQKKRLETVARIADNLVEAGPDLDAIYRNLFREVLQVVPRADNACIIQRDPDRQDYFIVPASLEFYKVSLQSGQDTYRVRQDQPRGLAIRVIETNESVLSNDAREDPDYIQAIPTTRSEICVPIELDGRPHAAMLLESNQRNAFSRDDLLLLTALSPVISIAIQRVQQLLNARERAELEKMGKLAVGLVHEITRAVANIPDLVEEIQTSLENGEEIDQECLDDLQHNSIQAKSISTYVRDLSVIGSFKPKPDQLGPVIERVVNEARSKMPAHCEVIYTGNQPLPTCTFHDELIGILLKNIIENALRAIPEDRAGRVEIRTEVRQSDISILIADNGMGITAANQPKVFEQPFTTKTDRSQIHGFGLWLCNQIAEIHKGKLDYSTNPGVGTTFIIRLPR